MMACRLVLCGSSVYAQKNWSCPEAVGGLAEDLSIGKAFGCTISVTTRERMLNGVTTLREREIHVVIRSWSIEVQRGPRMVIRY